jgi:hypothetical protein
MADLHFDPSLPLRPERLAELAGISVRAIYAACASGRVRHRRVGRQLWISLDDWRKYLDEHLVEPGAPRRPNVVRSQTALRREERREQASVETAAAAK